MYAFKIVVLLGALWSENVSADTQGILIIKSGYEYETKLDCVMGMLDELQQQSENLIKRIDGVQETVCVKVLPPLPKINPRRMT